MRWLGLTHYLSYLAVPTPYSHLNCCTHMHKYTHYDPRTIVVCTRAERKESPPTPGRSCWQRTKDLFLTKWVRGRWERHACLGTWQIDHVNSGFGCKLISACIRLCMYSCTRAELNVRRSIFPRHSHAHWYLLTFACTQPKPFIHIIFFRARSSLALFMIITISVNNMLRVQHKELVTPVSGRVRLRMREVA